MAAENLFNVKPIGRVTSERRNPTDDDWDNVAATIALHPNDFTSDALAGLDAFSHVEILFLFDRVAPEKIETGSRHPRGRSDWPKVGIFAQRGKNRPNRIGLSTCKLVSVSGTQLRVAGLDAIDGTPVLDIKPVMNGFEPRGEILEPDWSRQIMAGYWTKD